mgnify:CR=1 FL=1
MTEDQAELAGLIAHDLPDIRVDLGADLVPDCDQERCPQFDGKRCRIMGCRPSSICRPAVEWMAQRAARG